MPQTHARIGAVTSSPERGGPNGGAVTDPLPRDGQLSLGTTLSDAYANEGRRLLRHLHDALTSGGQSINDAAEALKERLESKVIVDFDTARRLFTLICVLHIRG